MLLFLSCTVVFIAGAVTTGLVARVGTLLAAPESWMADVGFTLIVMSLTGAMILSIRHNRRAVEATMRLAWLAGNDPLTGLPSRRSLDEVLPVAIAAGRGTDRTAVLVLDIDGLKTINDNFGLDVGDKVLRVLARRLLGTVEREDTLVRFGGDTFVVVVRGVADVVGLQQRADALQLAATDPVRVGDQDLVVSLSIGGAIAEEGCLHPAEVLADAEVARSRARQLGDGSTQVYDRASPEQLPPSSAARRLARALRDDGFVLHYQPIFSIPDRQLVGVEALIRWNDPASGLLRPAEFFHILRTAGLMVPVGRWAVASACQQAARWARMHADRPPVNVTINVSADELEDSGFVPHLVRILHDTAVSPDTLYLEIGEATLAEASSEAWRALQAVRKLGVHIALDDFGSTNGSITTLMRLRPELVKIDRVLHRVREPRAVEALRHTVEIAHALEVVVLAEGVEDASQVQWLAGLGMDLGQGYHLGTPQPVSMIDQLISVTPVFSLAS